MTSHHVGIVAHPARSTAAHQLFEDVGATYLHMDNGTRGCNGSHRRTLEWLSGKQSTFSVVLEDDAILCDNWADNLDRALELTPAPIISFYLGTSYPPQWQDFIADTTHQATQTNASWIVGEHLLHAVAYAIRTDLIPDFLAYDTKAPIDQAISAWARERGHTVAYTWPSICDHRDQPTLVNHPDGRQRNQPRKAWQHGEPAWNTTTVTLNA